VLWLKRESVGFPPPPTTWPPIADDSYRRVLAGPNFCRVSWFVTVVFFYPPIILFGFVKPVWSSPLPPLSPRTKFFSSVFSFVLDEGCGEFRSVQSSFFFFSPFLAEPSYSKTPESFLSLSVESFFAFKFPKKPFSYSATIFG